MSRRDSVGDRSSSQGARSSVRRSHAATEMSEPVASAKGERLSAFVLLVSSLALVATTAPPSYDYQLTKTVDGPEALLTSDAPNVRYRVSIRATGRAPNGRSTTAGASGVVTGTIAMAGITDAPFVAASVSRDGVTPEGELSALTSFTLATPLTFGGECKKPSETSPCTATFFVDFARDDGGDRGGSVVIDWKLSFDAEIEKDGEPSKRGTLPWTVEIVPE